MFSRTALAVLMGVVGACLIGRGLWRYEVESGPRAVVVEFLDAMRDGRLQDAAFCLETPPGAETPLRDAASIKDFSYSLTSVVESGGESRVRAMLTAGGITARTTFVVGPDEFGRLKIRSVDGLLRPNADAAEASDPAGAEGTVNSAADGESGFDTLSALPGVEVGEF